METFDTFITTDGRRHYFLKLTETALEEYNPMLIQEPMLKRYFACEAAALTDIYILCDDDIVPATQDTLKQLVELMQRNPRYSQIGLGWKHNMLDEQNNGWIIDKSDPELWEFDHCGGCVAIRKGTIKDLGYKAEFESGYGDDRVMGRIARELGYKVGVATKLYFHHLGVGMSTIKE